MQSLGGLKEERGYWKLKEEALILHCVKTSLCKWLRTCRKTRLQNDVDIMRVQAVSETKDEKRIKFQNLE
jgi:hypothetical protein